MPSLVENQVFGSGKVLIFSNPQVKTSDTDRCHPNGDLNVDVDVCDEVKIMLICAYIELILPLVSIIGSFFFLKEAAHVMGSNIPALCSVVSGSLYLALYYGGSVGSGNYSDYAGEMGHKIFKSHVALSMAVAVVGALCMLQVTVRLI